MFLFVFNIKSLLFRFADIFPQIFLIPIKEFYITSSVTDAIRLMVFFYQIEQLAGKGFVSIGCNSRIDAAHAAIKDMHQQIPNTHIYCWLRNKDCIAAIDEIKQYYPDVEIIGRMKTQPEHFNYNPKILLQVVPEPYRNFCIPTNKRRPLC